MLIHKFFVGAGLLLFAQKDKEIPRLFPVLLLFYMDMPRFHPHNV